MKRDAREKGSETICNGFTPLFPGCVSRFLNELTLAVNRDFFSKGCENKYKELLLFFVDTSMIVSDRIRKRE